MIKFFYLLLLIPALTFAQPIKLRYHTELDVAKCTMAAVMGRPLKIMSATKRAGLYIVSYSRPSDGDKYRYKVKVEGNRAVWANIDGRWRDTQYDERITFSEVGKKLRITQLFSDGSSGDKLY